MRDAGLGQLAHGLAGELVAGLGQDQAGLLVDQVAAQVAADQLLGGVVDLLHALLLDLLEQAGRHLGAGLGQRLAGGGIDQVGGQLLAAQAVGAERGPPALPGAGEEDLVVEGVEDRLLVEAQGQQQRGHRQLAAPVDADMGQVLGVELEVEPGAAIGDDAGGIEELARAVGLAAVVVEEHAWAAVHLRDDDALGAVDDEGAVVRHERHVAHVDILLLDVAHALRARLLVDVPDDQAQGDAQGCRIGHAALMAFLDVVLRLLELVLDEVERGAIGEVAHREDRAEHLLEPDQVALGRGRVHLQERVVGLPLHLDEVRHLGDFGDAAEALANPFLGRGKIGHG